MDSKVAETETYRGILITVFDHGRYLTVIAGGTEVPNPTNRLMLAVDDALTVARSWIDERIQEAFASTPPTTNAGFTRAELDAELAKFVQMVQDSYDNGMAAAIGPHTVRAFIAACAEVELTDEEQEGE